MRGWRRVRHALNGWTTWGGSDVADEAAAYLDGRLLECLRAKGAGGIVPPWIWLNAVAHGDQERIAWLASDRSPGSAGWRGARAALADELLRVADGDPVEVARLQRDVLVPLEMSLADRRDLVPAGLLEIGTQELRLAQI
jgi:hypothetical protein